MNIETCATCGKELIGTRAGSVTSYFFQHKYCQCLSGQKNRLHPISSTKIICSNCGKSRASGNRAGSMTSYLFKELRCTCAGARDVLKDSGHHTQTAVRRTQRQQFTENLANRQTAVSGASFSTAHSAILAPGTTIGGVFEVASVIGTGGMGVVYEVAHRGLGKQFALKILSPELVNEKNWQRFRAEAKILASLNHPTFVKVYDLGIHESSLPFYSMDYLKGRSLEETLIDDGPLPLASALELFIPVLNGLAYAHRNGIIHRDLKPGNIMLCQENGQKVVKILDFGISKLLDADDGRQQSVTMAGDIFGSPFYMSPEQGNAGKVDARSDIYSLGCTLFEALTGFVPFEGTNSFDTMLMHQDKNAPLISDVAPQLKFTHSIVLVVAKCLAKLPDERYQSAKELALDLERIKEGRDLLTYHQAFPQHSVDAEGLVVENYGDSAEGSGSNVWGRPTIVAAASVAGILVIAAPLAIVYWHNSASNTNTSTEANTNTNININTATKTSSEPSSQSPGAFDFPQASSQNFLRNTVLKQAQQELAELEKRYGVDSVETCKQLMTVASMHRDMADYAAAETFYRRAVAIFKRQAATNNRDLNDCIGNLVLVCKKQGKAYHY